MARAYRGIYARQSSLTEPYATAAVWGTGINAIHGFYGEGVPVRVQGRADALGASPVATGPNAGQRDYQQPGTSSGNDPPEELTWGYTVDYSPESFGSGTDSSMYADDAAPGEIQYMGDRPGWGEDVQSERVRHNAASMPSWGRSGERLRSLRQGAARYRIYHVPGGNYSPVTAEQPNSLPTETVSEGWENKVTSFVANAHPSDPSQYEVQTSMRQRYGTRNNDRAVERDTDAPRSKIASRVAAMVEKVYSTGERSYDMFPFQIDQIHRPFRYRTAGTGPQAWMRANAVGSITPIQRVPPADPAMGVPEVSEDDDFGYTGEDTMYYA